LQSSGLKPLSFAFIRPWIVDHEFISGRVIIRYKQLMVPWTAVTIMRIADFTTVNRGYDDITFGEFGFNILNCDVLLNTKIVNSDIVA